MSIDTKAETAYIAKVTAFRQYVFDKISSKNKHCIWNKASLKDVRQAVIIHSSSRSGSSLLFSLLKKIPAFYSLSGESVPFYKLNGLSSDLFSSDEIPQEVIDKGEYTDGLSRDFLSDFSIADAQNDICSNNSILGQYIDKLALRFPLQWPQISFSYDAFKRIALEAFSISGQGQQVFSTELFYLELLALLMKEYEGINPYYYDIPVVLIKSKFPELDVPSGPPCNALTIEEPPFILLSPSREIDESVFYEKILLLKSQADCYRMHFIDTLLPNAKIKIIYLTRNPAASINGLIDGWLHRGFFSHNLRQLLTDKNNPGPRMLNISGYSDKYDWGRWWWKYDLAPGWQEYAQSQLEEICAFQWQSANKAIQEYLEKNSKDRYRVKHEDIIRSSSSRLEQIKGILDFIGISRDCLKGLDFNAITPVQATQTPGPYRWKKRKRALLPLLENRQIRQACDQLGYDRMRIEEWL